MVVVDNGGENGYNYNDIEVVDVIVTGSSS